MAKKFRLLGSALTLAAAVAVSSTVLAGAGEDRDKDKKTPPTSSSVQEAPAGFDNLTNGAIDQSAFDIARGIFEERDDIAKGLGPVYNAQSCAECHQSPVTGGVSQVTVFRVTGPEHPGATLIRDRAIDPSIQMHAAASDTARTFRTSLNTLGDGFVEAIDDNTLRAISAAQPSHMRGRVIEVSLPEAPSVTRVGRFGLKNQQASLLGFSGDAYVNEIGITNRLFLNEVVTAFDTVPDTPPNGEDHDNDIDAFAAFMRATKAPPRGPSSPAVVAGEQVFNQLKCNVCHVASIVTAHSGTEIIPGYSLPTQIGDKRFHPFGDFLLHNVGTGDGIAQGPALANEVRTAPLWGVRTRSRFMHDGESPTFIDAIRRHGGQASESRDGFQDLGPAQKAQLLAFLGSL